MQYPFQSNIWRLNYANRTRATTTNGQSRILARIKQPFILTIFPDELIIEEQRVIWIKNRGPLMSEIDSIMATDIACVYASAGPFFGHIHVQSLTGGPEILVEKLPRGDVYQARSLIEGIALASREGLKINLNDLDSERENLIRAGEVQSSAI